MSVQSRSLLWQPAFFRYWAASAVSSLGDGISSVGLPITAAVYLHAGPTQMGYLNAAIWLPTLLFSLPAGSWADRVGRYRAILVGTDLARLGLLGIVPLLSVLGILGLAELYVIVFVVGLCSTLFYVACVALLPTVVPEQRYVEGQSLVYGGQSVAASVGPSLGGALITLLTAPLAIAADAASFLLSAILLAGIPTARSAGNVDQERGSTVTGLRFLARTSLIRTSLAVTATANFFNLMFNTLLVLYLSRDAHLSSTYIGLVVSSAAFGGVIGAIIASRAVRLIGLGISLLAGSTLISAPLIAVPLARGSLPVIIALLIIAVGGSGIGRSVQNITVGSLFAAVVPSGMRSQVKGAYQMVSIGSRPLGALAGGAVGTLAGLRFALLIAAVGGTLSCLWMIGSPLLSLRLKCLE